MNVTVLMPVKDGETFLPMSIRDIESNVSKNDEIIVIDDGSRDSTGTILRNWARGNQNVRIINNPKSGLVEALNFGLGESSNDWIARFDVDDRYRVDRLSKQRNLISSSIGAIFCDYEFLSLNGRKLGRIPSPLIHQPSVISLPFSQQTPHPGVLYNRVAIQSVGGYRAKDFPAEDISLWLRLAKISKIVSVPETLLCYRLSLNSISAQNRKSAKNLTRLLVSEIGIQRENVLYCLESWSNILDLYSAQALGAERSVLFYRNLKSAAQEAGLAKSHYFELREMRNRVFSNLRNELAILNLGMNKVKRQIYRSL